MSDDIRKVQGIQYYKELATYKESTRKVETVEIHAIKILLTTNLARVCEHQSLVTHSQKITLTIYAYLQNYINYLISYK